MTTIRKIIEKPGFAMNTYDGINVVYHLIKKNGFKGVREGGETGRVLYCLSYKEFERIPKDYKIGYDEPLEDVAPEVSKFFMKFITSSGFERRAFAEIGENPRRNDITGRTAPIIAAAVSYWMQRVKKDKEKKDSGFFGEVGSSFKDVSAVFRKFYFYIDKKTNQDRYRVTFKAGDNFLVWFSPTNPQLNPGDEVKISGKVMAHKTYAGTKNTVVGYVTIKR